MEASHGRAGKSYASLKRVGWIARSRKPHSCNWSGTPTQVARPENSDNSTDGPKYPWRLTHAEKRPVFDTAEAGLKKRSAQEFLGCANIRTYFGTDSALS